MSGTTSWHTKAVVILGMIGTVTALVFSKGSAGNTLLGGKQAGGPRLISVEPLPEPEGLTCAWAPANASLHLAAAFQRGQGAPAPAGAGPDEAVPQRKAARAIHDPSSSFSAVAVDPVRNEVVVADENLHGLVVYDRLTNTPPTAAFSEPKRTIAGSKTNMEYQCGVYVDPASGDIYSIDNDTHNMLVIFSRQAKGNVPPDR